MAKVEIVKRLLHEIEKKFKGEAHKVVDLMETLADNPFKGKPIGRVAGILIKEIKYKNFRFYFILEGEKLKVFSGEDLEHLLIRFVRMSDKKDQQKVINEIKNVLLKIGSGGFEIQFADANCSLSILL